MENKIHAGFITRNTITSDSSLIVPVKEIEPSIAPNVTIRDDWISESVGIFFSVIDSIKIRYKITICEKGSTVEGSLSFESKKR